MSKGIPSKKAILFSFSLCYLTLIAGLRNYKYVGVDMIRYSRHYENAAKYSFRRSLYYSDTSQLYYASNWISRHVGWSFQTYVLIVSVFCVSVFGWYIYKWSKSPFLSLFVYLGVGSYTFLYSGLKQSIAMAVMLIAVDQYNEKHFSAAFMVLVIAFFFHPSAIIMLPYFIISKVGINKLVLLSYFMILILSIIFRIQLGRILTLIYDETYLGHYSSRGRLGGTAIFVLGILIIYALLNYDDIKIAGSQKCKYLHGLFIMFIIQVCSSYAYSFTRINLYYMVSIMTLVIPQVVTECHTVFKAGRGTPYLKILSQGAIIVIMIALFYGHIRSESLQNYYFLWQNGSFLK